MKQNHRSIFNVIVGLFLSCLFAWATSYFFVDSLLTYEEDSSLQLITLKAGSQHYHRSEGWAQTEIGEHGIIGANSTCSDSIPKVAIWGDSYVEAFQVDDKDKVGSKVNFLLQKNGITDLQAIQIGQSGCSLADYCCKITKYEKVIPGITSHFIIIGDISDLFPNDGMICQVTTLPKIGLSEVNFKPEAQRLKRLLATLRFDFVWDILKEDIRNLRLDFNPSFIKLLHKQEPILHQEESSFSVDVCRFLLDELKSRTSLPVTLVWCPSVPRIENGTITFEDDYAKEADELKRLCELRGIEFINMKNDFRNHYLENRMFVRGFVNSKPASGHMNADGHHLTARAILKSLLSRRGMQCSFSN